MEGQKKIIERWRGTKRGRKGHREKEMAKRYRDIREMEITSDELHHHNLHQIHHHELHDDAELHRHVLN